MPILIYIGFLTHGRSCVRENKIRRKRKLAVSDIGSSFGRFAPHQTHTIMSFTETGTRLMRGVYCRNASSLFEHVIEFPNILQH